MIWEYVFLNSTQRIRFVKRSDSHGQTQIRSPIAAMHVCRAMRAEMSPVFSETTCVDISNVAGKLGVKPKFNVVTGWSPLWSVRQVVVRLDSEGDGHIYAVFLEFFKKLKVVQVLWPADLEPLSAGIVDNTDTRFVVAALVSHARGCMEEHSTRPLLHPIRQAAATRGLDMQLQFYHQELGRIIVNELAKPRTLLLEEHEAEGPLPLPTLWSLNCWLYVRGKDYYPELVKLVLRGWSDQIQRGDLDQNVFMAYPKSLIDDWTRLEFPEMIEK